MHSDCKPIASHSEPDHPLLFTKMRIRTVTNYPDDWALLGLLWSRQLHLTYLDRLQQMTQRTIYTQNKFRTVHLGIKTALQHTTQTRDPFCVACEARRKVASPPHRNTFLWRAPLPPRAPWPPSPTPSSSSTLLRLSHPPARAPLRSSRPPHPRPSSSHCAMDSRGGGADGVLTPPPQPRDQRRGGERNDDRVCG